MTGKKAKLKLFLDEGVPKSVGQAFEDSGHTVIHLEDALAKGSTDPLVCATAVANDAILVAHDGDMKQIAKNRGLTNQRFKRLSLIKLSCKESRAAGRVKQAMSLIEHEWRISEEKVARRLHIEIKTDLIRTMR